MVAESPGAQAVRRTAREIGTALWRLLKDSYTAEACVRAFEGIGVELRYEWNGELRVSKMFKAWEELEAATTEKR